ncbi:hypothetical protein [Endozoicomonas sp. 4G]|uniref:hypothetical protein n=1 Tax=Endozoicomonas sp. 4G TaxID=2872754 RepID=UPI0020786727|nr:hypothetical protein [Endozoicomonas sp. 4G]
MYKPVRSLLIFFLSSVISGTCYPDIEKLRDHRFRITNSEGKVKSIDIIGGPSGFIDYFAEVFHTSQRCFGCTAYLYHVMGRRPGYYLYYEQHVPNKEVLLKNFLTQLPKALSRSGTAPPIGLLMLERGGASKPGPTQGAFGILATDQSEQPRTMFNTEIVTLEKNPDGSFDLLTLPDQSSFLKDLTGHYHVVDEASFKQ